VRANQVEPALLGANGEVLAAALDAVRRVDVRVDDDRPRQHAFDARVLARRSRARYEHRERAGRKREPSA
jgi:hypothetical protein